MSRVRKLVRKSEKAAIIIAVALGLTVILMNLEFNLLESTTYDFRMARGPQVASDRDIVLIAIDDLTLKSLDELQPLPLDAHAKMMDILATAKPKAVGYLVDMNRVAEANIDVFKGDAGKRFIVSAKSLLDQGVPVLLGTRFGVTGEILPPYPLNAIPRAVAVIHKDGNVFSEDKVTRRGLIELNGRPVFHTELARKLGALPRGRVPKGTYYVPEIDASYFFFRYHGSTVDLPGKNQRAYKQISFSDVLKGVVTPGSLRGKIILVGTQLKEDSDDFAYTPYSRSQFVNPKLVIHANILDSIMHDDGISRVSPLVNWIVTFLVTASVLFWVLNSTPLYGVFATLSLVAVFIIFGQLLFLIQGLWIRESQPLVGIFLGYYLAVPYRLILEYKQRWDYQRKNEILLQVEELKRNFMSLITHDLKTPVARIQGLAEVLLKKAKERLIERDKETLNSIVAATDELNRFITSILELNKVESKTVHLNKESKDVNQLIERSVENFQTIAKTAGIAIKMNLEPLFPIRVDASLVSKVINNLIDNAIKYSLSGSEVLIESRENGNWVEVSVKDQGIGMSEDEAKNLFTRFYRAKNDTTTKIAGTGLGLYLTKYFVEAHSGRVEVETEKEKGSIFRILLPINNSDSRTSARDFLKSNETGSGFLDGFIIKEDRNV